MNWTRRRFIKAGLLSSIGFIVVDSLWVEKFFIETNVFFHGNANENRSNIKVIQISDLHIQSLNYQLKRLCEQLNKIAPDLILITGDAVDKAKNLPVLDQFLKRIDQNIKKVAIPGNWEYWANIDFNDLKQLYSGNNVDFLINDSKQYEFRGKTITITGIDDYVGGNADAALAFKKYIISDYHIVLNHCPEYSDQIFSKRPESIPVDFVLSGHTHGGQINLFGFVPFKPQGSGNYLKGWYKSGVNNLYVSKGIGTSIIPVRFMSRAEMAVFSIA